jgi:hypothetical protein
VAGGTQGHGDNRVHRVSVSPRLRVASGPVAQRKQSVCLLNRMSQVQILPGSPKALPIFDCRLPIGPTSKVQSLRGQLNSPTNQSAIGNWKSAMVSIGNQKCSCGVAQAGKSVRLINERVRVRIPPPRPITLPIFDCRLPISERRAKGRE